MGVEYGWRHQVLSACLQPASRRVVRQESGPSYRVGGRFLFCRNMPHSRPTTTYINTFVLRKQRATTIRGYPPTESSPPVTPYLDHAQLAEDIITAITADDLILEPGELEQTTTRLLEFAWAVLDPAGS